MRHHHQAHHDDLDQSGRHHQHRRRHARRDEDGHGRRRARRGAIGSAILALLAERPMHGYELIAALDDKSGGRWKPSPGSIYPALRRLEHRGFIAATESDDEKRRFELTDAGRARVAEQRDAGHDAPWDEHGLGHHGDLRRAVAELVGPARQIGRFGTDDQTSAAVTVVKDATARLYRILADGPPSEEPSDDASEPGDAAD
jgi:DNA-binding PadR family transcriptional regulator